MAFAAAVLLMFGPAFAADEDATFGPAPYTVKPPDAELRGTTDDLADLDIAYGAYQRGLYLTAFSIATRRAKAGDVPAMTLLGEIYARGLGVPKNMAEADAWYSLAAKRGDRNAQFALSKQLLVNENNSGRARGLKMLEQSARSGHAEANYHLGLVYLEGTLRRQDYKRAGDLFALAAERGMPDAQYALGLLHVEGAGVKPDIQAAAYWIGQAAKAGLVEAQVEYAIMVFKGRGVDKDPVLAAQWFQRAARAGNPVAQNRLARLYTAGVGVTFDAVKAATWHLLARSQGLGDPKLDIFVSGLAKEQTAEAEAAVRAWPGGRF